MHKYTRISNNATTPSKKTELLRLAKSNTATTPSSILLILKGFLYLIHEALFLLALLALALPLQIQGVVAGSVKLTQGVLGSLGQLGGHLYHQGHIVIAPDIPVAHGRYALALQADLGIRLGTRLHLVLHIPVHGGDTDGSAQSSLGM